MSLGGCSAVTGEGAKLSPKSNKGCPNVSGKVRPHGARSFTNFGGLVHLGAQNPAPPHRKAPVAPMLVQLRALGGPTPAPNVGDATLWASGLSCRPCVRTLFKGHTGAGPTQKPNLDYTWEGSSALTAGWRIPVAVAMCIVAISAVNCLSNISRNPAFQHATDFDLNLPATTAGTLYFTGRWACCFLQQFPSASSHMRHLADLAFCRESTQRISDLSGNNQVRQPGCNIPSCL